MSGGEQQMLALARTFVQSPRVVLLAEVSVGLAPTTVDEIFEFLAGLIWVEAHRGTTPAGFEGAYSRLNCRVRSVMRAWPDGR